MFDALTRRLPVAAAAGITTVAWYALPDYIRSRPARLTARVALVAGAGAAVVANTWKKHSESGEPLAINLLPPQLVTEDDSPARKKVVAVGMIGAVVGGIALTVVTERAWFRWGERRRDAGKKWAHTLPAVGAGLLAAASAVVDVNASDRTEPTPVA